MARLTVESGPRQGSSRAIEGSVFSIGRSSSNDFQVPDTRCSRRHAEVTRDESGYLLRDLNSRNSLYVNDCAVEDSCVLCDGDRIRMGDTVLRFDEGGDTRISLTDSARTVRLVDDPDSEWGQISGAVAAGSPSHATIALEEARGEQIRDPLRRLEVLYDVTDRLRSILDLDTLLGELVDIFSRVLSPDIIVVMLRDEDSGVLTPRTMWSSGTIGDDYPISRSIVDDCAERRVSVLFSEGGQAKISYAVSDSIVRHRIRSAICSPLIHQGDVLGAVYIDTKSATLHYQKEELALVNGIVNQAAMAIANVRMHTELVRQQRLEREMEIARSIQMNLLPKKSPELPGFDVWGMSAPAKQVGGDYFDYIERPDGELALAVADVAGKGVPAAILAASLHASLQAFGNDPTSDVETMMLRLNRVVCHDATVGMFVATVFGILDSRRREFTYSNAGQSHPLLVCSDGTIQPLDVGGVPFGITEDAPYEVATIKIPPASVLFLYSDGVTDAINGNEEMFGVERLEETLRSHQAADARGLCQIVFEAVCEHSDSTQLFDDCTLVALKSL